MLEDSEINDDFLVSMSTRCKLKKLVLFFVVLQCNIEGFYDKKENVVYLHLVGSFDAQSLLKIYELYSVELEERVSGVF